MAFEIFCFVFIKNAKKMLIKIFLVETKESKILVMQGNFQFDKVEPFWKTANFMSFIWKLISFSYTLNLATILQKSLLLVDNYYLSKFVVSSWFLIM